MGGWYCLNSHLCGLALLLQLLQLLCSQKTHWFVPSNQFCPRWHRGQDDVSTQPTDVGPEVALDDGGSHHTLAFHWLADH